ncbi:MAG: YecA family protein, partial [Paucibacter sp.]|nr:YecA family protein [Roseateles sp.]
TGPLFELVLRRHRELNLAIIDRQWFDPWVFELDEDASPSEVVMPWVVGFSLATELFPALTRLDASELLEPLASLYLHLDPDDLEDADELLEEIETLEPPEDVAEAVESLVRSTLLLADVSRPLACTAPPKTPPRRPPPRGPRR